ncbi:hypothetical protein [Sneathiella glossodoripedis]|uniref:hypothetical protein n=1 Tax=Sneathiella glossodoripedis TaxID=418853 RepID=UPI00046F8D72|nr:hypothetical protein [Sneathiella glossodoripedis]
MERLEQELGALRTRIETMHLDMVEVREDLKGLMREVSMGRGAVKVLGVVGTLIVAVSSFGAWLAQIL